MNKDVQAYHNTLTVEDRAVCDRLFAIIDANLPGSENKIWHRHPVWFLDGNPTVGYSKQKAGIRLMFWSGADFDEPDLLPGTGKFKDASIFYTSSRQVNASDLQRWLKKSIEIQWDYKNIVKNKGVLHPLY